MGKLALVFDQKFSKLSSIFDKHFGIRVTKENMVIVSSTIKNEKSFKQLIRTLEITGKDTELLGFVLQFDIVDMIWQA